MKWYSLILKIKFRMWRNDFNLIYKYYRCGAGRTNAILPVSIAYVNYSAKKVFVTSGCFVYVHRPTNTRQKFYTHSMYSCYLFAVRRVAPQFSKEPPTYKEVKLGDDFNITCVAIGWPMPYVKWQREPMVDLTPEDHLPVGKNVLEIKNAQTSENYTCIAASSLGSVNATTYVKVQCK